MARDLVSFGLDGTPIDSAAKITRRIGAGTHQLMRPCDGRRGTLHTLRQALPAFEVLARRAAEGAA
jgi:hypothetical protein